MFQGVLGMIKNPLVGKSQTTIDAVNAAVVAGEKGRGRIDHLNLPASSLVNSRRFSGGSFALSLVLSCGLCAYLSLGSLDKIRAEDEESSTVTAPPVSEEISPSASSESEDPDGGNVGEGDDEGTTADEGVDVGDVDEAPESQQGAASDATTTPEVAAPEVAAPEVVAPAAPVPGAPAVTPPASDNVLTTIVDRYTSLCEGHFPIKVYLHSALGSSAKEGTADSASPSSPSAETSSSDVSSTQEPSTDPVTQAAIENYLSTGDLHSLTAPASPKIGGETSATEASSVDKDPVALQCRAFVGSFLVATLYDSNKDFYNTVLDRHQAECEGHLSISEYVKLLRDGLIPSDSSTLQQFLKNAGMTIPSGTNMDDPMVLQCQGFAEGTGTGKVISIYIHAVVDAIGKAASEAIEKFLSGFSVTINNLIDSPSSGSSSSPESAHQ